jgi:WD40 repeat protein
VRLVAGENGGKGHGGEVFACAYTADGGYVLSGGWDGHLRLWDTASGTETTSFRASGKPIAACAVSPDGRFWMSACLDGLLATWDATNHSQVTAFMPHGRPLSAIVFSPDGKTLATASWDRNVILWNLERERDGRTLSGHEDIVAGCCFTPDGQTLLSWSHDRSLRLWDVPRARPLSTMTGHDDRVTAGAISPDGRWAASGARDGGIMLWELEGSRPVAARDGQTEVRSCFFLLDGETLAAVDQLGRLTLYGLPDLEPRAELATRLPLQCAELAPSGRQLVLGCSSGHLRFVLVEEFDEAPLVVTGSEAARRTSTMLQRMLGKSSLVKIYRVTCPVCRQVHDLAKKPGEPFACSSCRRRLRVGATLPAAL